MQLLQNHKRLLRAAIIPGVFALGAVTAVGLRGNAGQPAPPVQPPAQALDIQSAFEQVADKLRPSVVFIKSRQAVSTGAQFRRNQFPGDDSRDESPFQLFPNTPGGRQFRMMPPTLPRRATASGSGVIVRSDGYILTNDHVVEGADKVTVQLQDGREFQGEVRRDFRSDLALIKINATGLPAAELADSDKSKVGQWAIAFGSPFGLSDTMTVGIVSSLNRDQSIGSGSDGRRYTHLIQTDASINPGNSGGPLIDIYGRVIGINVAIESPSGGNVGIGFAIPANTAKFVMDQLITKGSVTRGYLGIGPKTLDYDEKKQYGVEQGALVASVQDGTPAAKAGIQVGDVVVRYNGQGVKDEGSLRDLIARTKPNQSVNVTVHRDGADRNFTVTLGTAPDEPVADREGPAKTNGGRKLGISVAPANNAEARKQFNLKGDSTQGVIVGEVVPGSPAAEAGFAPGDVLLRLNGKAINSPEQLTEIVRGIRDGSNVSAVVRRGTQTILINISMEQ
jgi:serine protease Do